MMGAGRLPSVKLALFAGVVLGLLGILAFAAVRETTSARPAAARPSLAPPRPALTAAEEAYALALWPIHNEVKAGAFRMTFGGLDYKLGEIDRRELRARVEAAREIYRQAEARMRTLSPPASFQAVHAEYVEAVGLYQRSAAEMVKTGDDGSDEHLLAAFPMSQEAGRKLLRVGNVLWPGEYVPN
jgi:hypothetical protein